MNEETKETIGTIIGIVSCGVLLFLFCKCSCACGTVEENKDWRNWTVDTGRAEYYLDDKHERQWRWKELP